MSMQNFDTQVSHESQIYPVAGRVDARFTHVADSFAANFASGDEVGAALAITLDGKTVVDLWGGFQDADLARPWLENTIVNMMSVSKGVAALCIHMLADRGLLDVNAPVATYWPAFAAAGKESLPLRFVLDHRAGLPYLTEKLARGSAYDQTTMADALARQAPLAPPGTDPQYHVMTQGYLLAEVVRRVAGKTLGTFLREEIAAPLALDYGIGLSSQDQARCATFLLGPGNRLLTAIRSPDTPEGVFWAQLSADEDFNSVAWRSSEIPSANGHGTARAMARLYGALACGGTLDGVRLLGQDALGRMTAEQHHLPETLLGRHYHQALGVILNSPPVSYMGPNPRAFGHQGAGGAHGFADPDCRLGFSYAPNQFKSDPKVPTRQKLVEATFKALA
jgi:CubicO group peptidase (beta-lactamase class C family)